jgi:hypothetical protein
MVVQLKTATEIPARPTAATKMISRRGAEDTEAITFHRRGLCAPA